jgi:hypothetical protein
VLVTRAEHIKSDAVEIPLVLPKLVDDVQGWTVNARSQQLRSESSANEQMFGMLNLRKRF